MARSTRASQIDELWTLDDVGYGFSADEAIRRCQARFCATRDRRSWAEEARTACFEWDDGSECLAQTCGNRSQIESQFGRDSVEYLSTLVCRQSDIRRHGARLSESRGVCEQQYDLCLTGERYYEAWQRQLSGAQQCWWTGGDATKFDAFFDVEYKNIGRMAASEWLSFQDARSMLSSGCTIQRVLCDSLEANRHATLARIAAAQRDVEPVRDDPFPRPREFHGRFDSEVLFELEGLGDLYAPGARMGVLAHSDRLTRLGHIPEAEVAIAELVGFDTYFATGGERLREEIFSPAMLSAFRGPSAQSYPYGRPTVGFESEIAALGMMAGHVGARGDLETFSRSSFLQGEVVYEHLRAMLSAQTAEQLASAYEALVRDVDALGN